MNKFEVAVIGLWHQGVVASACLAESGINVIGVNESTSLVESLLVGKSPIFEPGLERLLKKGIRKKNYFLQTTLV